MSKQEEVDFWPGYVDALMNLVLNLLFLSAIFAIAIFVLGMESSRLRIINSENKGKMQNELAKVNENYYASNISLLNSSDSVGKSITVSEPEVANSTVHNSLVDQKNEKSVVSSSNTLFVDVTHEKIDLDENDAAKVTIKKEKDKLLGIFYPRDLIRLDDGAKAELSSAFKDNFKINKKFIIWGVSSPSSAVSNRLTFLRIMAIRNVLLDLNVANSNISIDIYGGNVDTEGGKIYILGTE